MGYATFSADETLDQFTDNLHYRDSQPGQVPIYEENRRRVIELATYVFETLPKCPERTIVRRRLEDTLRIMNQIVAVKGVGIPEPAVTCADEPRHASHLPRRPG